MNKNNLRLWAFALLAVVLLVVPLWMVFNRDTVLTNGKEFKFRTAPVDPYDPFRGKYVTLNFDQSRIKVDNPSRFARGQRVFVEVRDGQDGFAELFAPSTEAPDVDHYLEAEVDYSWDTDSTLSLLLPFNRYYMEESKADDAESLVRNSSTDMTTYAMVSIFRGQSALKKLVVGGKPIEDHF